MLSSRRRLTTVALAAVLLTAAVDGQQSASLQARIEALRTSANLPAVAAVTFDSVRVGDVVLTGVRKAGDPTPVAAADLWHIGSLTKSFTATLVAKLVERGKLSWTTTIADLVGTGRAGKFANATIQQVLGHRAGFARDMPDDMMQKARASTDPLPVQRQWVLNYALSSEPVSTPGTALLYSNMGYVVIGAMLEQQTGMPWEQLVRDEVLTPLRLTTAGFGAPGTRDDLSQPRGHGLLKEKLVPLEPPADNPPVLGPAGTLHMSIVDLARWGHEHLRGERGADGLVRAATYKVLHAPLEGQNFALGWRSPQRDGVRIITHDGSNGIWTAVVTFDPATDRGVVVVANAGHNVQAVLSAATQWVVNK